MMRGQVFTDKLAIGISLVCTVHCLVLPVLLVLLPSLTALQLDNEAFHTWMLIAVLPTSTYAIILGCRQHKRYRLLVIGFIGLVFLVSAIMLDEKVIGEIGEKLLTVIGACLVALGHLSNYRLCRETTNCGCLEHNRP